MNCASGCLPQQASNKTESWAWFPASRAEHQYKTGRSHPAQKSSTQFLVTASSTMVHYSIIASALLSVAAAQSLGKGQENQPKITTYECTKKGGCKAQTSYIVLDSASHSIHQKNDTTKGCGNWGSAADPTACPDKESCAKNCVLEPISNYADYGIVTSGASMRMDFYGKDKKFQSPRAYLLNKDKKQYEMLKLTGGEFSFDVDVSKLPCGMNGALYLSEMRADGGRSKLNPGGASVGTGYCDAQCFVTPWVNGEVSFPTYLSPSRISANFAQGQPRRLRRLLQRDGHLGGQRPRHLDRTPHLQQAQPLHLQGR